MPYFSRVAKVKQLLSVPSKQSIEAYQNSELIVYYPNQHKRESSRLGKEIVKVPSESQFKPVSLKKTVFSTY